MPYPWSRLLLATGHAIRSGVQPEDSGYIGLRVADNLRSGHGPVFNAGERVDLVESPLWLAFLAVAGGGALRAWLAPEVTATGGVARSGGRILVDEAQFFAPLWMRLIQKSLNPRNGHLFLVADPTQGFLGRGASWN